MKTNEKEQQYKYFLAIDIGASNGRHILGHLEEGKIYLEEVHRFPNGMENQNGTLVWNTEVLFGEIKKGMKKCSNAGKIPLSVGIDTWGVDYVLLDESGNMTSPVIAYRDSRTDGMIEETAKYISDSELYFRTGIQKMIFNTIYQLMAVKTKTPEYFNNAKHLLFMPDYLHYLLSGKKLTEYTIASTSGLLNAISRTWDDTVIEQCGFPRELFGEIVPAGTFACNLTGNIMAEIGYDCSVILPPSHDTASAFLAVPAKSENSVYISSGTWSLMGVELDSPITTEASREANLTNEGGYAYRYRYLKNIMGLWMIQSVQKEIGEGRSFKEISDMARVSTYNGIVDVEDDRFFAPVSMVQSVQTVCSENGFDKPESLRDIACCIYRSLALSYAKTIDVLETLTGKKFDSINIIGGGSNNDFLNELTARECGLTVYAGPSEGTALGNLISQMIEFGELSGIKDAREMVTRSFDIKKF